MTQAPQRLFPTVPPPSAESYGQPPEPRRRGSARQGALVLALLVAVVAVDQSAKWWAWRHVSWVRINSGGDALVGNTIGGWFAAPGTGTLLDLLDVALLSAAVWGLVRFRARAAIVIPGALMTAGWVSNLLDRLGVHNLTAPGSNRGVVDFIHLGPHYYNLADFFIIGCTPLFVLAVGYWFVQAARRQVAAASTPAPALYRERGFGTERALETVGVRMISPSLLHLAAGQARVSLASMLIIDTASFSVR